MPENHDKTFQQARSDTFDAVIALIDKRIQAAIPALLLRYDEISETNLRENAEKESWSLFLRGVSHLKNGAPGNQPGSITEALSRMSLRSSTLAASIGIKPPQFEPLYFSVNYTAGDEAALFFCRRLIEAATGDLLKSRQIIHQKMMREKPDAAFGDGADLENIKALKRQMAFSFNVLADAYSHACHDFKETLSGMIAPRPRISRAPDSPPVTPKC